MDDLLGGQAWVGSVRIGLRASSDVRTTPILSPPGHVLRPVGCNPLGPSRPKPMAVVGVSGETAF